MDTQAGGLLEQLQAIRGRAEELMARLDTDAAFSRQPRGGKGWSVGQCLDHLTQTNRLYVAALRDALAGAPRASTAVTTPIRSTWLGRTFIASMEPGYGRFRAPKKIVPRSATNRAQVWADFRRELDEIEALVRDAACIDLNTRTFPSPLFGLSRLRAGTALRVMFGHMRRHLQQAENVVAGYRE